MPSKAKRAPESTAKKASGQRDLLGEMAKLLGADKEELLYSLNRNDPEPPQLYGYSLGKPRARRRTPERVGVTATNLRLTAEEHELLEKLADQISVSKHSIMHTMTLAGVHRLIHKLKGKDLSSVRGMELLEQEGKLIAEGK